MHLNMLSSVHWPKKSGKPTIVSFYQLHVSVVLPVVDEVCDMLESLA